jgi:DNA-binding MarR family transcriptional regulator
MKQRIAPQAGLQRRILFALAAGTAPSIVVLANRIGATRPAVSRSLHALGELGLAEARGRSWSLTAEGRAEAENSPSRYAPGVERALARQAVVEHRLGLTLTNLARSAVEEISAKALFGAELSEMTKSADMIEAINAKALFGAELSEITKSAGMIEAFGKSRADLLGSLVLQVSALKLPPAWWSSMVADNLGITARVAADVEAMGDALRMSSRLPAARANGIERAVKHVVSAYHDLLSDSMRRYLSGPPVPQAASAIVTPTITTAAFTGTARELFLPSSAPRESADLQRDAVWDLADRLDSLGAASSARDLRAAWDVLKQRRPGWSKAGAHLMREVLRETLDELAPPVHLPRDEDGRVTKHAQVVWIVGHDGTLALWVEATALNVGKMHSFLSAEAKNSRDPRLGSQGFLGLLETLTGLVRTLVDQASQRKDR